MHRLRRNNLLTQMFNQTFQTGDIPVVLFLVLLEGLLSADNALVLAMQSQTLPASEYLNPYLHALLPILQRIFPNIDLPIPVDLTVRS